MNDTIKAIKNYELWMYLGWIDVAQRYKRSKVGPFWLTLNNAIVTLALSVIWSKLFNSKIELFLPYFAISNVIWIYISTSISESASMLIASENLVKQIKLPISSLFLRVLTRNFIIFLHLLPVPILVFLVFPIGWSAGLLGLIYSLVGLFLLISFLLFFCIIVGITCARYRDLVQAITSILQLIFLATPVLWNKDLLNGKEYLYELNIFFHLIEIIRAPILYNEFPLTSFIVVACATAVLGFIWTYIYRKYSRSIVYWL